MANLPINSRQGVQSWPTPCWFSIYQWTAHPANEVWLRWRSQKASAEARGSRGSQWWLSAKICRARASRSRIPTNSLCLLASSLPVQEAHDYRRRLFIYGYSYCIRTMSKHCKGCSKHETKPSSQFQKRRGHPISHGWDWMVSEILSCCYIFNPRSKKTFDEDEVLCVMIHLESPRSGSLSLALTSVLLCQRRALLVKI